MSDGRPVLSVIVPAKDAADILPETLGALIASDYPREQWELVVVDDGSEDPTSVVAARFADTVVRLAGKPRGPAYARNRGFEVSRGRYAVFIDADVRVHPPTLRQFVEVLEKEPDVSAVFGSYDADPPARGLVSQYRNLLHHYVHQESRGDAETFWAGCGAVRADVFSEVGMYDEWHFSSPQIEDIELGRRIRLSGHRIVLRPEIQSTHLKKWTLGGVLRTDFQSRGVPWTRLIMHESPRSLNTLNIRRIQRWCTVLVGVGALAALAGLVLRTPWPLIATGAAIGLVLGANVKFYELLRRRRGLLFAIGALPLHLLYYLSNCLSLCIGWLTHTLVGAPQPPVEVAAYAEVGVKAWPPVPTRPKKSIFNGNE